MTPGHWYWESDGTWSMTEGEFAEQTGTEPFVADQSTTARLRVTFSDVPAGYESWFAADLADNATSVRCVPAGDTDVDFAVLPPDDYRTDPLDVVVPIQSAGDPRADGSADQVSLSSTDWTTSQEIRSFMDLNKNGVFDEGIDQFAPNDENGRQYEYFDDLNEDGFWDLDEPGSQFAFIDENGNGQWDSGPWTNDTVYVGLDPVGERLPVEPLTLGNVRVLEGETNCWSGPYTFSERLLEPQTVPDDPNTDVDESGNPRTGAYVAEGLVLPDWCSIPSPADGVFVPKASTTASCGSLRRPRCP